MKIIVSVTNDLVTDQRVHKVCLTLHQNGYKVLLVGRKLKNSNPINRPYSTHRMRLFFNKSALFYAEYNFRLFFFLLFKSVDIYLSNDTDTLLANYLCSIIRRKHLVFDAHEMFPETPELVNRKFVKSVWQKIEDIIFPKLKYCYTVCDSIADIYNKRYNIRMKVVRNIPLETKNDVQTTKIDVQDKYILLYQGAINVGRGIEWMIQAMPLLDDFIFYIAGDGDVKKEMVQLTEDMAVTDRVKFLGRIPFEQLHSYTICADIGISLLKNQGLNYYYSLPNRIFDFIRAEVPILATDFPEIKRIIEHYDIGYTVDNYDPTHIAQVLKQMIKEKKYKEGLKKANKELTWENESKVFLQIFDSLIIHNKHNHTL